MRGKEKVAAALMVGMLALNGCQSGDAGKQTFSPTINSPRTEQPAESAWRNLSSLERIKRIENGTLPDSIKSNVLGEFVKATSEFYCEQIPCNVSQKDLESRVHFLSQEEFLKQANENLEPSSNLTLIPEIVPDLAFSKNRDDRKILVSTDNVRKALNGNDSLYYPLLGNILFHAFSHIIQSTEKIQTKDIVDISFPEYGFKIRGISNLVVLTTNIQDGTEYEFSRTMEALTELIGKSISEKSGTYLPISRYTKSAEITEQLMMKKAGIDFKQLLEYYKGEKSLNELFLKLGSIKNPDKPDLGSGLKLYILAGTAADNDPQLIISSIEQEIGQKLFN